MNDFWAPDMNVEKIYAQAALLEAQRLLCDLTPLARCGEMSFRVGRALLADGLSLVILGFSWSKNTPEVEVLQDEMREHFKNFNKRSVQNQRVEMMRSRICFDMAGRQMSAHDLFLLIEKEYEFLRQAIDPQSPSWAEVVAQEQARSIHKALAGLGTDDSSDRKM